MILAVLFWILLILSFIGPFIPALDRPSRVALLILILILGLKVFGNPMNG
jgi:hypothetical protein